MSIAAVPDYLGKDFSGASPGMRFGMYLKLWERPAWAKTKDKPLEEAKRLNDNDKKTMAALCARQQQAFDGIASAVAGLRLDARSVALFTTGLGNEHPLENGFAFLNPYGLPYLPGSGVKGVLRQAARELASGDWGETHGWQGDDQQPFSVVIDKKPVSLSMSDVLFGRQTKDGESEHVRGALTFWDVIPQIKGDSLAVEIMTPHQSHYYQIDKKKNPQPPHFQSPHDSGQPNPISFLTVPPGSGFVFHVVCDTAHLGRLAPALLKDGADGKPQWQDLLTAAFEHAFEWLGFGAKTAVGYGAMRRDQKAEAARQKAQEEARREAETANMTPQQQTVQKFQHDMQKRFEALRGKPVRPNGEEYNWARQLAKAALEEQGWTPEERRAAADAIELWLPKVVSVVMKDERKKLKLNALRGES